VAGEWFGQAANRLGLSGEVLATDFRGLCENQNPSTQESLTVPLKTTRTEDGQTTANRRIFYDFTFSPPNLFRWLPSWRKTREIGRTVVALRFNQSFSAFQIHPAARALPTRGHDDFGPKFSGMAGNRHTIVCLKKQFLYQKTEAGVS
jgi:TrwC relaxase